MKFQVAASNSSSGPFTFVGPDGTASTFFTASGASLSQFDGFRYLRYKAYLSTTDGTVTPSLSSVIVCFEDTAASSLSATPSSVGGGGAVTVTWNGVTNPTTHDWIGLYHPGDANTAYSVWAWIRAAPGRRQRRQELRLLRVHDVGTCRHLRVQALQQRQLHPLATSSTVTVTSTASLSASPASISRGGR